MPTPPGFVSVTFDIKQEHVPRLMDAMEGLYPIPQDDQGVPLFTKQQWARVATKRLWIRDVKRWEAKVARDAASQPIVEIPDNEIDTP